ncbi:MAG TPA: hypothetical protein VLH56_12380 [Dissulfurispiraceae bacterium]|nr:hypothetical protein [Dissulfurispiraceae bacterium]
MKKLVLISGIGMLIVVILAGWALIAGIGFVSAKFPQLIEGIERITGITIEKAKEALPRIEEKAKEVPPEIAERIKGLIPDGDIPEKDVGGEDIIGIPRHSHMVRISFAVQDGKRTIGYKSKSEMGPVIDFYDQKMLAMGFKKKVLSASPVEEVHEYRKAKKAMEFSFKEINRFGVVTTEMVIREL